MNIAWRATPRDPTEMRSPMNLRSTAERAAWQSFMKAKCRGIRSPCESDGVFADHRWKEPGAFPATDHAAQRTHQGRGRHPIRRRVGRQCGERDGVRGSLIPHAGAVRPLVIAMIEAPFGTPPMALARRADRGAAGRRPTRR